MTLVRLPQSSFWSGKKVLLTGHTGFKGGWLTLWLSQLGAEVTGFSLEAPTVPSFFELTQLEKVMKKSVIGDIRDRKALRETFNSDSFEFVFHLAAQPLVRASYDIPIETFAINALGTAHVLEEVRHSKTVKTAVMVTTDKCYENQESHYAYKEGDRLGGHDPYSNSKAQAELVVQCYQDSYFYKGNQGVASARAGNVIGGGDFAVDRLIPDFIRAIQSRKEIQVRSPHAVRPWQHVLEPLKGYILLAENLSKAPKEYSSAFNFGPEDSDCQPVAAIVEQMRQTFKNRLLLRVEEKKDLHEATLLKLDSTKAKNNLNWFPTWNLQKALAESIEWYELFLTGADANRLREISLSQIKQYTSTTTDSLKGLL